MIQLSFAQLVAVRIIMYSLLYLRLNVVLKPELHGVLELELEQTNKDSKMFYRNHNKAITTRQSLALCSVHSHHPFPADRLILFAANVLQCFVNGEENPQNCPFPWDFVTVPEEDRATAIGNTHRKIGRDRTCGSGDILADRQTDRHTGVLITILRHHSRGRSHN